MQSGAVDVKPLSTHRFLLKDHEKAFQAIREKKETVVKVLFVNEERQEKNEGSGS